MKAKQKDNISKRYLILVVALSIILGAGIVVAGDEGIEISITPATLNLDEIVNKFVIVHTEIPYDQVDTETLELKEVVFGTNCFFKHSRLSIFISS
jgi:hypothetical protein